MSTQSGKIAPIGISTYSRLGHLKQTITALQGNTLAAQSDLYVFSDAPSPGDEAKVASVREYLRSIDGFKSVSIIERESNDRIANNRGGMRQLLDSHGKLIFLEEDIITAPGFLQFVNDALNHYEHASNVFSVCGYCPPVSWSSDTDVFCLNRFCGWGFGITASNFNKIREIPRDKLMALSRERLTENGRDLYKMMLSEAEGKINALDVRAMFWQLLDGSLTVYPKQSLVQNIGHDGTGVHCGTSARFNHDTLWNKTEGFIFEQNPTVSEVNKLKNQKFRDKRRFWKRILSWK